VLTLALIALAACGPTIPTVPYEIPNALTFSYPEGWAVEESLFEGYGLVVFSPEEGGFSEGLGLAVFYVPRDAVGAASEPKALLEEFAVGTDLGEIGEIRSERVGGADWVRTDFDFADDELETSGWVALTDAPEGVVLVIAASPPDDWSSHAATFQVIYNSMALIDPETP
jgi:hypothetical protein